MQGKGRVVKGDSVSIQPEAVLVRVGKTEPGSTESPPAEPSQEEGTPEIETTRSEEGLIQAITVRCPCGREITLNCDYLDDGGSDETDETDEVDDS